MVPILLRSNLSLTLVLAIFFTVQGVFGAVSKISDFYSLKVPCSIPAVLRFDHLTFSHEANSAFHAFEANEYQHVLEANQWWIVVLSRGVKDSIWVTLEKPENKHWFKRASIHRKVFIA